MHWEKEIRVRITIRRVVVAVLAASTVANLMIVGAVYGADPAPTETPVLTAVSSTSTFSVPTVTVEASALPWTPLSGIALTDTPAISPTDTLAPTQTRTEPPIWKLCIRRFYWPTYRVTFGDTLFKLAAATGSTVEELISANCLRDSRIYVGQVLYLPRAIAGPIFTLTATQTSTASVTPSHTSTPTPTDTPTATDTPAATDTPTYTPTNTPPSPTFTPTDTLTNTPPSPTFTPTDTPTTPAAVCDHARLVGDITFPSGTVVRPGMSFTKIWRFENIGACTWKTSYSLVYMDGEPFGDQTASPLPVDVPPGGMVDVAINMVAPSVPGIYRGYWMFLNARGAVFGLGPRADQAWWLDIEVSDQIPEDVPTVFENHAGYPLCDEAGNLYFEVLPRDPQGIRSVMLSYTIDGQSVDEPFMRQKGELYYYLGQSKNDIVSYYFEVTDGMENVTKSPTYEFSTLCLTIN